MITMRTYSEEKRSGTIELLLTSPVTDVQIILGKFFGALALYAAMLLVTMLYMIMLFKISNPECVRSGCTHNVASAASTTSLSGVRGSSLAAASTPVLIDHDRLDDAVAWHAPGGKELAITYALRNISQR